MIKIAIEKKLQGSLGPMQMQLDLEIQEESFVVLSGESGSGKTSLLRILAGLESATGVIDVSDVVFQDNKSVLAPQKREIGFVFQDYALFANMSVEANLLFVNKDQTLCDELLAMTHLSALKTRLPATLSGGQKQRVALCRAMMKRPKLLLLDEPLSALDPQMRHQLQDDILALHKRFKTTTLMVSHDPSEIYRLADRVLVLSQGKVVEDGSAKAVLLHAQGSQKFSFEGELLEIIEADMIFVGVVAIGQQIVEVVMDAHEADTFSVGDRVQISTKAFSPSLSKL